MDLIIIITHITQEVGCPPEAKDYRSSQRATHIHQSRNYRPRKRRRKTAAGFAYAVYQCCPSTTACDAWW